MNWSIPLGVEVLVKKAAVDPEFRTLLHERRAGAADEIGLRLDPAEAAMLAAVPQAQLEAIIDRTTVPQEHRRAFLGKAAAAMLAALGAMAPGTAGAAMGLGAGGGIRADSLPRRRRAAPIIVTRTERKVRAVLADVLDRDLPQIQSETNLKTDLEMTPEQFEAVDQALEAELRLPLPLDAIRQSDTAGDVIDLCETTEEVRQAVTDALSRRLSLPGEAITVDRSVDDLDATPAQLAAVRRQLAQRLRVHLDWNTFRQQRTVGDLITMVAGAVRLREENRAERDERRSRDAQPDGPVGTFGIQPDLPPQPWPTHRPVWPKQPPPRGASGGIRP